MHQLEIVALVHFCQLNDVDSAFIEALEDIGLIEIIEENRERYLKYDELSLIERCLRLHRDLNINVEALATISYLSELVQELKKENRFLRARLSEYSRSHIK
jgi:chaperone modulatory protein CbpM